MAHRPPLPKRSQLLQHDERLTHADDKTSVQNIIVMARRIGDSMDKLATLSHATVTEYAAVVKMINLEKLKR